MTTTATGATVDPDAIRTRICRELPGLRLPELPRRFLLVEFLDPEPMDDDAGEAKAAVPELFAWGLAFPGSATMFHPDGRTTRLGSADRALALFGRVHDIDLVWVDHW